jgi:MFS family permease/ParB-like chromosome segregation protein Spo0J
MVKAAKKIVFSRSRDIPFNKLVLSASNVRRIRPDQNIDELAEDIARREDLVQGLNVRPVLDADDNETGMFEVPAGGRRYRAIERLVKAKRFPKDGLVPCIVRDPSTKILAEDDSLAENVHRVALHPLDQFRAFLDMREKGMTDEEIAVAFFTTAQVVKQRLRLASVSPKLCEVYAEDGMTLEQLMAFSVTDDHARQEQVWDSVSRSGFDEPYIAYLFRTINAVMAARLATELGLGADDLGLLTSVYFLTFAAAQIPVGILLDRYGPRRVQSVLSLVAAVGSTLFAVSDHFLMLLVGRALIGLGVASAMTAGLKALVLWFPEDRVPLLNGLMVMLGALGAVTATLPADLLLDWIGWRELFGLLAGLTVASAVMIYLVVPEATPATSGAVSLGLRKVYADPRFWRVAPLSASCIGTAWALQGLWAAQWFKDVEGLDRAGVVIHLFAMAVALSLGAILLGAAADRLRRRGVGTEVLLGLVAALFIASQFALILRLPLPSYLQWAVVAAVGSATVLSFAILAEYFPKELAGRANGALNLFHIALAFVVQYATGVVVQQWAPQAGHYPEIAYQTAFALNLALQVFAWIWFMFPRSAPIRDRRSRKSQQPYRGAADTHPSCCCSRRHRGGRCPGYVSDPG